MAHRTAEGANPAGIRRIGQRRQVVIPKVILDQLHLREGDLVEVTARSGRVSLKPRKMADPGDSLSAADAKKVRTGLKQAREGKTLPWNKVKHDLGL